MQAPNIRYLFLSVLLLAGAGAYALLGEPLGVGTPRWPTSDAVYAVDAWSAGPLNVQQVNTADFITREYRDDVGTLATLTIETYQTPKLYAAGPEVPFLGNGYVVSTPAPDRVPVTDTIGALVARQGTDAWLVMYAYGERRGLLGNGPLAWTFAVTDGLLARPNDYFKLYLSVRADDSDTDLDHAVSQLAHTLFWRIQAWYAA